MEFIKLNVNPKEWKREGDCVVRAIARATCKEWLEVYDDLYRIGRKKCRMMNSQKTYEAYLEEQGYTKQKMPRKASGLRYTIGEYVEEHPDFTGIISVAQHLTYVLNGVLIDTWDCSRKYIGNYWTK